jgi:uncharacterized lipoprotein YmbA
MRRRPAWNRAVIAVVLATGLAGCGAAPPIRFYLLTPADTAARAPSTGRGVTIGLGPVTWPTYLDRPQIVTRAGQDELTLAELDQWAEPLRENFSRVLAENLSAMIPTERIAVFPWRGSWPFQYQVLVDVSRFDGPAGGEVALDARWRIVDRKGQELTFRTTGLREPAGRSDYAAMAAAMSRLVAGLSREIAAAVNALP